MNDGTGPPKGHRVLHSSDVRLPLTGASHRVHKVFDPATGHDYLLAFDRAGARVDHEGVVLAERTLFQRTYGKLHPHLYDELKRAGRRKQMEVFVWLRIAGAEPKKTTLTRREMRAERVPKGVAKFRRDLRSQVARIGESIVKQHGLRWTGQSGSLPVFSAMGTSARISEASKDERVAGVLLCDREGIDDLQASLDISRAQEVVYVDGHRGAGVRVAVWESGPDKTTDLSIESRFKTSGAAKSNHARLTTAIIKNREEGKPHGYAPDCLLHSANSKSTDALEWAVNDKLCSVVSQSFHRKAEQSGDYLSADDILKDQLVLQFPYPTILQAAGNITKGETAIEFVNHKGFNALSIGSHDDAATAMASTSTYRNPTTEHGDRELPELSANGTRVSAVGLSKGGTSFAAPAVAGAVAVLHEVEETLRAWPEGTRAILLAGARANVRDGNWQPDMAARIDARDGAGALDLRESTRIAQSRGARNSRAVRRGYEVGLLEDADVAPDGFARWIYRIKVPWRGASHVKVALCWDSKVVLFFPLGVASILTLDLDLKIFRGDVLVADSSSWDNSYEIAEFDAEPGDEFTV